MKEPCFLSFPLLKNGLLMMKSIWRVRLQLAIQVDVNSHVLSYWRYWWSLRGVNQADVMEIILLEVVKTQKNAFVKMSRLCSVNYPWEKATIPDTEDIQNWRIFHRIVMIKIFLLWIFKEVLDYRFFKSISTILYSNIKWDARKQLRSLSLNQNIQT